MAAKSKGGMIKVRCPNPSCRKVLAVKAELGGKKGRCPMCGQAMTIPKPPEKAPKGKAGPIEALPPPVKSPGGGRKGQTVMLQRSAVEKRAAEKEAAKREAPPKKEKEPERKAEKAREKKVEEKPAAKPVVRPVTEPVEKPVAKPVVKPRDRPEPVAEEKKEAPSLSRATGPEVAAAPKASDQMLPPPPEEEKEEAPSEGPPKEPTEEPAAGPVTKPVVEPVAKPSEEAPAAGPTPVPGPPSPVAEQKGVQVGGPKAKTHPTPRTLKRIATEVTEAAYDISGNTLSVTGAIGYDLNPVFRTKCDELLEVPDEDIVVDLTPVLYLSSSHLGVLAELMGGADLAGKKVTVRASLKAARVIRLAGLDRMCTLEET